MLQKLQSFPRNRDAEAEWSRLHTELAGRTSRSLPRIIPRLEYIPAAAAGLLILGLLAHPAWGGITVLAIVVMLVLPWAIYCTSRHVTGLLIVMVLIEAVAASAFAATSEKPLGALVRYPIGFLFVLPFLWTVWRSGILRKGGFRDYAIYLTWAVLSTSYSILPGVTFTRSIAAIIPFCAFCAIAVEVRSGEDARRAMGVLLAGCGVVVAANYLAMLIPGIESWQPDTETGMLRFVGFLTEPNEIGNLMLTTVGAGFCYWQVARGWKKALAAIVMTGATVQAVMADSRSPIVGIAIGCAVYLVWKYRVKGAIGVAALFAIFYTATYAVPGARVYLDRGDIASFTGRQVAWDFAIRSVEESPLLGYGYEVEGQILSNQHFSGWDEVWNLGYQSSLHDGLLSRAVSLGIPALLLWLFLTIRPMVSCFFRNHDPWKLSSIVMLAFVPVLILNFTESISDFRSFDGVLMALSWAILERERLFAKAQAAERAKVVEGSMSPIVRALQVGHA